MSNLLSADELIDLTGSTRRAKQIDVLTKHGIRFIVRTDGKIRTTWTAVNAVLAPAEKNESHDEPDLDFLRHG